MNIQKLAKMALDAMITKTRANGDSFIIFKDGSPDWMVEMARDAHNNAGMLPDDYRYSFIKDALWAILEHGNLEDARNSLEADCSTYGLTNWLNSRNDRYSYVDQAIEDFGKSDSVINDIRSGQLIEIYEVFDSVVNFLETMAKE